MSKTMVRSECLCLVKLFDLIQTIILIRLLLLSGISKICVSFADKYNIFVAKTKALISCTVSAVTAQLIFALFSHMQKSCYLMTRLMPRPSFKRNLPVWSEFYCSNKGKIGFLCHNDRRLCDF